MTTSLDHLFPVCREQDYRAKVFWAPAKLKVAPEPQHGRAGAAGGTRASKRAAAVEPKEALAKRVSTKRR